MNLVVNAVAMCTRTNALGSSLVDSESGVALQTLCSTINRTVVPDLRRTVLAHADILCGIAKVAGLMVCCCVQNNDHTYECTRFCRGLASSRECTTSTSQPRLPDNPNRLAAHRCGMRRHSLCSHITDQGHFTTSCGSSTRVKAHVRMHSVLA